MEPTIDVYFSVKASIAIGEEVRVCGNYPSLGCLDVNRAIPLFTSPSAYPIWTTRKGVLLPEKSDDVRYRYCIFSGGKFRRFEKFFRPMSPQKEGEFKIVVDTLDKPSTDFATSQITHFATREKRSSNNNARSTEVPELNADDSVIIVSYFLPVIISHSAESGWSVKWNFEIILSFQTDLHVNWIGSVPYTGKLTSEDEDIIFGLLREMKCHPIFIQAKTHKLFYDVYCKRHLWPVLNHHINVYGEIEPPETETNASEQELWSIYTTVNQQFRNKVVEIYQEGSMIWIHGFHLMLLPSHLRQRTSLQAARIGLFFHTAFPSSEIWKVLPRREDLLRGMLAADQIGFHQFESARHFFTTCRRLLNATNTVNDAGLLSVLIDGREVIVSCNHVGIDRNRVYETMAHPGYAAEVDKWKSQVTNKIVICSIDRLEKVKCIPLKLILLESFLKENPQWVGKLVFVLIGISTPERGSDYIETQRDVIILVQSINARYPGFIIFEERKESEVKLARRLSLFAVSDVLLITCARPLLDILPMEYTLARSKSSDFGVPLRTVKGGCPPNLGLIILSEFDSSVRVMRGSLLINPWQSDKVKLALSRALEMDEAEIIDRMKRNMDFCDRLSTVQWAGHVLHDLKQVTKSKNLSAYSTLGFGTNFRVMDTKVNELEFSKVVKDYRMSRNRLILLDWGGTLVDENDVKDSVQAYAVATGHANRSGPSKQLQTILENLCADTRNVVFVVSGKKAKGVYEFFGNISGLGLAAEHGNFYRFPSENDTDLKSRWQSMFRTDSLHWKDAARVVMDMYVQRTHGTYIEEKGSAIIWQFRDADPEFGFLQSKELEEHLTEVLIGEDVDIMRGGGSNDGYIEVRQKGLSKGYFLKHIVELLQVKNIMTDFLMTVGDDASDEPMFEEVERMKRLGSNMCMYSITVGKKPTVAEAFVPDAVGVMELLTCLMKSSANDRKFFSAVDLPSQYGSLHSPTPRLTMPHINASALPFKTDSNSMLRSSSYTDVQTSNSRVSGFGALSTGPVLKQGSNQKLSEIEENTDRLSFTINEDGDDDGIFF